MTRIPTKLKPWFEARRRFKLSHAHTQMARELGMNPRKLGSLAGGGQEPWKLPLPKYIGHFLLHRVEFTPERLSIEFDRPSDNLVSVTFAYVPLKVSFTESIVREIARKTKRRSSSFIESRKAAHALKYERNQRGWCDLHNLTRTRFYRRLC
jgi:hypothetical protein